MKMSKPTSITSLLKEKEKGEKSKTGTAAKYPGISTNNRFLLLAEKGKAARDRSLSAKRFRTDSECTEAECTGEGAYVEEQVFMNMEKTEGQLKEAKAVIEQVKSEVEKIPDPGPMKTVLDPYGFLIHRRYIWSQHFVRSGQFCFRDPGYCYSI